MNPAISWTIASNSNCWSYSDRNRFIICWRSNCKTWRYGRQYYYDTASRTNARSEMAKRQERIQVEKR